MEPVVSGSGSANANVESKEDDPAAEIKSEDIVVPIVKDEYNFLTAFFLARNDALLKEPDMQNSVGGFAEFGGKSFLNVEAYKKLLKKGNRRLTTDQQILVNVRETLIQGLNNDIRKQDNDFKQSLAKYQNSDHILYDFCANISQLSIKEKYVFLIRNEGETSFRLPEGPGGAVFVPEMNNDQTIIIVFLEVVVDGANHYYNLVVSKNTTSQGGSYPYCGRYVIKENSSGTMGCNLANMGKQQVVVDAIDFEIAKNGENKAQLEAFRNIVSDGLSPKQQIAVDVAAVVTEEAGDGTETSSIVDSDSSYAPSDNGNPRVPGLFETMPSFKKTLFFEKNVCGDKMIVELLKTSVAQKRPSLFSGGRRYKKMTKKRRGVPPKQNKTARNSRKNV